MQIIVNLCALTTGYAIPCRDAVGGIKTAYFTEFANVTSVTPDSSGNVTVITMAANTKFRKYDLVKETGELTEKIMTSVVNGTVYYEQDLNFTIRKMVAIWRNEIRLLAQNLLIAVVVDANGNQWICGLSNGLDLDPSDAKTGKAKGDFNGYELKFKGKEELPMAPVTQVMSALI
jgi:hypothetical protein